MKISCESATKFEYEDKEGEIVILTHTYQGPLYQFEVYNEREYALNQLWNAYKCHYSILFCSDESVLKEHYQEVLKYS